MQTLVQVLVGPAVAGSIAAALRSTELNATLRLFITERFAWKRLKRTTPKARRQHVVDVTDAALEKTDRPRDRAG